MAMKRLGDSGKSQYVMLGDSLKADIASAANADVDSMWYAPDLQEKEGELAPIFRVYNYFEIARILLPKLD